MNRGILGRDDDQQRATAAQPTRIDYAKPVERHRLRALSISAIMIAVIATGASVGLTLADLWPIPGGTPIRQMGLALNVSLIAIATFAIGAALVIIAILVGRRDPLSILLAIVAMAVSLAPLPAESLTADWIVARHSLVWAT